LELQLLGELLLPLLFFGSLFLILLVDVLRVLLLVVTNTLYLLRADHLVLAQRPLVLVHL